MPLTPEVPFTPLVPLVPEDPRPAVPAVPAVPPPPIEPEMTIPASVYSIVILGPAIKGTYEAVSAKDAVPSILLADILLKVAS